MRARLIAGALVGTAVYFAAAYALKITYQPPPADQIIYLAGQFHNLGGSAFMGKLKVIDRIEQYSDDEAHPERSPFALYENDVRLGPAHSLHRDIMNEGKGRFSHWEKSGFIFSTSDNTDPNTNGRMYWVGIPK